MHDISFFLLKNWLPVGVAAIVFFLIGLLFAKFIWGRYTQRLAFAVEENLNLASQWSALGASQRDLFKKLRSRWQSDRDAWESAIADKEARIVQLNDSLMSSGKAVPEDPAERLSERRRIEELETNLKKRDQEIEELKKKFDATSAIVTDEKVTLINTSKGRDETESSKDVEALRQQVRDLEQDLIDTHDELHDVRAGYLKQVELVESLEAKLIGVPSGEEDLEKSRARIAELEGKLAEAESREKQISGRAVQSEAILAQRSRELLAFRRELSALTAELNERSEMEKELEQVRAELRDFCGTMENQLSEAKAEYEAEIAQVEIAAREKYDAEIEEIRVAAKEHLEEEKSAYRVQIVNLKESLQAKVKELDEVRRQLETSTADAASLERKKGLLQAELNDACHEMYDVRAALRYRLDEIDLLEARLDELDLVEEELGLAKDEKRKLEATLSDTRHELSDVRLAYNEKVKEWQTAKAQMEELEAIIEDRGAEVNDLSAELRQHRDTIRTLKNTLAEREGEIEALSDESRKISLQITAKTNFSNQQQDRISALEQALAERYTELNSVREDLDDKTKAAKYHASRSEQLEAELERRVADFDASDQRIAGFEEALFEANRTIAELSARLEQSDRTIAELQEELRHVSRDKDDKIHELERASKRIADLEAAARAREEQVIQIEHELLTNRSTQSELDRRLERLNAELEHAREEKSLSQVAVAELEEALKASDGKTLQLSNKLEEKERELGELERQLTEVRERLESRETLVTESEMRVEQLRSELEEKTAELVRKLEEREQEGASLAEQLADARSEVESRGTRVADSEKRLADLQAQLDETIVALHAETEKSSDAELEMLRKELETHEAKLQQYAEQRRQGIEEIDRLRAKVASRGDSIRELQSQISNIMMQRASRDNEIALLKDKLRAVEEELKRSRVAKDSGGASDLEKTIQKSLAAESGEGEGTSLDELAEKGSHHAPKSPPANRPSPAENSSHGGSADDLVIYFDESSTGLTEAEEGKIDQCARALRKSGRKLGVTIIGFAGSEGTADYTESLSARRADAVRARLLERGVPQSLIHVQSAGQDRRFSDWKARRVELVLAPEAVAETVN